MLAGLVKNPVGLRPDQLPRAARSPAATSCSTGWPQLNVITQAEGRELKERPARPQVEPSPNGCAAVSRRRSSATTSSTTSCSDPSLGKTADGPPGPAPLRRPDHPDHDRPATTRRPPTQSVTAHVFPTDQAIGGLAMVEPGTGNVKALAQSRPMGSDKAAGQTYLNYVVPAEVRRLQRLPGRLDVQGRSCSPPRSSRASRSAPRSTPRRAMDDPGRGRSRPATAPTGDGELGHPQLHRPSGTKDLYTGTQESVNTFFAQLEQRTGLCEPFELAKEMGIDAAREPQQVPSFILGVADVNPLTMAEAYATFAARGLHCDARPVTADPRRRRQALVKDYPQDLRAGACRARPPTPSTTSCAASWSPAASARTSRIDKPSAGKTGTNERQHVGVVRRLHPATSPPPR